MANPINCNDAALPISIDLIVNVTKEQVISTVDLSVPVFVSSTGPLPHGAGRIRFYTSVAEISADFGSTSEAVKAGNGFFDQNPRPSTMAVAQAFDTPQPGFMTTAVTGAVSVFVAISDGSFTITIDGVTENIGALDFTSDTNFDDIAATLQTGLQAIAAGGYTAATVVASNEVENQFTIISGTSGDGSTVSVLAAGTTGTDISGVGFLNGIVGVVVPGYTPTTFTNELDLIAQAATCSGRFVYGLDLDVVYRDAQQQLDAMAWAEVQEFAFLTAISNNPLSYDPNDTSNNIVAAFNAGYTRTATFFDDDVEVYPGMAYLAILLSVDYSGAATALTMKFKNLVGIPPVNFVGVDPETAVSVLNSRRANTFTIVGNGARVVREGVQASTIWFSDDRSNIDNFINDLLTNIYNVFLTTPKVPYTSAGEMLIHNAEAQVCDQFVRNGTFADRITVDTSSPNGIRTIPAYQIIFAPLQDVTIADRAARILRGNQIIVQLEGAIHTLVINIIVQD